MIGHQILFTGPGILTGTIGTASEEECRKRAPEMAREIKRERNVRWVAFRIFPARWNEKESEA